MRKKLFATTILPLVFSASAEPIVIANMGDTVSASSYVPMIHVAPMKHPSKSINKLIDADFHSTSKTLKVGYVQERRINNQLGFEPIYLVGTDEMSIAWVKKNQKQLQQLNATGLLVNVKNRADYENFVAATGLRLSPISGDAIARKFAISHYPVLITDKKIEQ